MRLPFITRAGYERAVGKLETDTWALRRQVKTLREREAARIACVEVLEGEYADIKFRLEEQDGELAALRERARLLVEDNKELRRRYDTVRAELGRAQRELTSLRLMKASLEARVGAGGDVSGG